MGTPDTDSTRSAKASHLQLVSENYIPPMRAKPRRLGRWWVLATVASAALGATGWAWLQQAQPASALFSHVPAESLPHPQAKLAFDAFEHPHGAPREPRLLHDGDVLTQGSGITFAIYNRTGLTVHLLLFAVDSQNKFVWWFPEDTDAKSLPLAAADVSTLGQPVHVPSASASGQLSIVALFSTTPLDRRAAQEAFGRGGLVALGGVGANTVVQTQPLVLQP